MREWCGEETTATLVPPVIPPQPTNCPVLSVTSGDDDFEIDRAVMETIPTSIGRRNRQVFELARG